MSEIPQATREREELQERLVSIDNDQDALAYFIDELYLDHPENPQIFYAAASHLTALTYLRETVESTQRKGELVLPPAANTMRAFHTYTRLLAMLRSERQSPLYRDNDRISKRLLIGSREELAFEAVLTYACAQGAEVLMLPSPARLNFSGAFRATDIQVFMPPVNTPYFEIQIKHTAKGTPNPGPDELVDYDPRIPVLSLGGVLGKEKAREVQEILWRLGQQDDPQEPIERLAPYEHDIILEAAAGILISAGEWRAAHARHRQASR